MAQSALRGMTVTVNPVSRCPHDIEPLGIALAIESRLRSSGSSGDADMGVCLVELSCAMLAAKRATEDTTAIADAAEQGRRARPLAELAWELAQSL